MADCRSSEPLEEQTLPRYRQKKYYPVIIGEAFKDQYRVIAKLGFGAYSTVWLAKDERTKQYVSLKVCIQADTETSPVINEVKMLRRLGEIAQEADHPGLDFTRLPTDIFEVDGQSGHHFCIASKPQGCSLRTLQELLPNAMLPKLLVKSVVHRLLFSLNWLHAACEVVHTDISPQNVLTEAGDDSVFQYLEEQESQNPNQPTMSEGVPIYKTRTPKIQFSGIPVLTDFGQVRPAEPNNKDWWMPDLYRAPEVLLGLPWSFPVDVWSVGVMTLELLEGKNLFDPMDRVNNQYVLPLALAQYIGYLGPPPPALIKQSPLFSSYFDNDGKWSSEPPIPETSFEDFVTVVPPGEEKDMFMKFVRKILTWDQEKRATGLEVIQDEWLMMPPEDMT